MSPVNFSKGEFHVKFTTNSTQKHLVNLTTPSCSCADWRKTQYPCKHFFTVFNTFPEWDFNSLPEHYRNSVFITLDTEHLEINTPAVYSSTRNEALVCETQDRTDNYPHDKSQDSTESGPDLEMETENPSPTDRNAKVAAPNQEQLSRIARLRKILQTELNAVKDTSFLVDEVDF